MMKTLKEIFDEMPPGPARKLVGRAVESGRLDWGDPYDQAYPVLRTLMKEEAEEAGEEEKPEERTGEIEESRTEEAECLRKKEEHGESGVPRKGISRTRITATALALLSAILVVGALISQFGLPAPTAKEEPTWVQCKLLLNSDSSYDFLVAFSDEHDDPMIGVEGTGYLKTTYGSQILYDSDFAIGSTDYTRKMPGDSKQRTCAFIHIPAHAVDVIEGESSAMGRARMDFTTKTGAVFQDIEFDVEVPHKIEE